MKIIFVVLLLSTTAALGQATAGVTAFSNEPVAIMMQTHERHASQQSMSREQNLLGSSSFSYGKGERPLWEVAPNSNPVPLGDVARALRKQHETAKKAEIVWQN
jgi:hypothetical protein